ncbi:MAG: polyprenol monophosphomannose synthase [Micrococcales bacterium]
MKHLVIMPTYNERENLVHSVTELLRHNADVDVLIVDDNSPDGTGQLADELAATEPRLSVLHRESKAGLGPAYLAGFAWGRNRGYEFLIEMDADGSHRAEDLPRLIAASSGADLVIGSRWIPGGRVQNWPLHRKLISRVGNLYVNVMLGAAVKDMTAGFRVYRAELLARLDLDTVSAFGYSFQVEMAWRAVKSGAKVVEVPITFVERTQGNSKMTTGIVVEALWLVTRWGIARLFGGRK